MIILTRWCEHFPGVDKSVRGAHEGYFREKNFVDLRRPVAFRKSRYVIETEFFDKTCSILIFSIQPKIPPTQPQKKEKK